MFDAITNFIALRLGIDPATLVLILGVVVAVCNLLGKLIPDSATGWLGTLRKVCKVLGLYITNRLTPTVSAGDVTRSIAATLPDSTIKDASDKLPSAVKIGTDFGTVAADIVALGKKPGKSASTPGAPKQGDVVPDQYRTDGPFAAQKKKGTK